MSKKTQGFELTTRTPTETIAVEIVDPVDGTTPTGIVITVAGRYSPQAKAAQFALAESIRAVDGEGSASAEVWDARMLDLTAACTLAWSGLTVRGEVPTCTRENAIAIYREFPWVREQVQAEYQKVSRFFGNAKAR